MSEEHSALLLYVKLFIVYLKHRETFMNISQIKHNTF